MKIAPPRDAPTIAAVIDEEELDGAGPEEEVGRGPELHVSIDVAGKSNRSDGLAAGESEAEEAHEEVTNSGGGDELQEGTVNVDPISLKRQNALRIYHCVL